MAKTYSPEDIRYIVDNYLLPIKVLGRHLKRSPEGIKLVIKRLVEDGRIIKPVEPEKKKIWYKWGN